MSWRETFPGRFERPLDSIELFFKTIGEKGATYHREHLAVRAYAKFLQGPLSGDTETALKQAWKTIRYLQPQIAASLEGTSLVYAVPEPASLDTWMAETFLIETVLTVDDLLASPRRASLPTLHYLPQTSEILFCCSHWRIDAFGATSLLNLLFKTLAEPPPVSIGDEWKNLSPSRDDAAQLPRDISQEDDDAATSLLMEYTTNLPALGLPVERVNEISGAVCRKEVRLSPTLTAAVLDACKAHDLTVTTAVHSAMIVALQALSSDASSGERYTSWGTFDYRPQLPASHRNATSHPISVMPCILPLTFTTSTFHDNASSLKRFYTQLQDPFVDASLHALLRPYTEKLTAMLQQPLPRGTPQPTEPILNNLGILARYLGNGRYGNGDGAVEVTGFWLGGVVLTRQPEFYVWTWQGRLTLSMCYNEQYYSAGFVGSFMDRVVEALLAGLGVEREGLSYSKAGGKARAVDDFHGASGSL